MKNLQQKMEKQLNHKAMRRRHERALFAAIAGFAGGTVLGLLFAPKKGSEIRKKLSKKGDKYINKARKDAIKARNFLTRGAEEARTVVSDVKENAKNKGEELLQKAKVIADYEEWTKEELYEKAKEASIDGYSQMNKDELIKALKKN